MDPNQLWNSVREEVSLKTTRATFETHIAGTQVDSLIDDILTVYVPNKFSREWLDVRLRPTIEESVQRYAGRPIDIHFTTTPSSHTSGDSAETCESLADDVLIRLRHVDPRDWKPEFVSRYALMFWQPLLGPKAFCVWLTLKMFADAPEPPSLTTITIMTTNSTDTRRLLGRNDRSTGALRPLLEHNIVAYHKLSSGKYVFDVLARLPLLTPTQVSKLHQRRRQSHARILDKFGVNLEEWQRIEASSLADVT